MEKWLDSFGAKDWVRGDGKPESNLPEDPEIIPVAYFEELNQVRQGSFLTNLGLIGLRAGRVILLATRFLPL